MTSKERAALRARANSIEALFQIGKAGLSPQFITQIDDALRARELIKISVLENSPEKAREAAQAIAGATDSQAVQVIGRKITLYRYNPELHGQNKSK